MVNVSYQKVMQPWNTHTYQKWNRWRFKIPAAFFDRFFLWSFWLSSTLPRLVCLAYVRGFYFLFCCVEVSSVVLCLLCCVALWCNPLCCVALRCVVSVLLRCVALCCDPLLCCCVVSVEFSCVVLRCDPLCCVALCCVALLTSSAFLVFCLC